MKRVASLLMRAVLAALLLTSVFSGVARADGDLCGGVCAPSDTLPEDPGLPPGPTP